MSEFERAVNAFMTAQNKINEAHQRSIDAHRELIVMLTARVELLEKQLRG